MQMHTFKKGDKVHVIASTMGGNFIIEGRATVKKPVADIDEQYVVNFNDGYGDVERFVDPLAQDNPAEYVARLNDPR